MGLDDKQVLKLGKAITEYGFPPVYFDFRADVEVRAENMRMVEDAIRDKLVSTGVEDVRDGLANVIYWGYSQKGYRDIRVRRFRDNATDDQLRRSAIWPRPEASQDWPQFPASGDTVVFQPRYEQASPLKCLSNRMTASAFRRS